MPLFDYIILDDEGNPTGEVFEELFKLGAAPDYLVSSTGRRAIRKQVSLIAKTSQSWASACGTQYGVNGYFNRGLGCYVHSDKEAEQIAKDKGLIRLDEVSQDKHFIDDHCEAQDNEYLKEEAEYNSMMQQYESWGIV